MGTGSVTGWFSREFSVCRRCLSPFSTEYARTEPVCNQQENQTLVKVVLEAFDLGAPLSITRLGGTATRKFAVRVPQGRFVVRVRPAEFAEERMIRFDHEVLWRLTKEGLPVPSPQKRPDGTSWMQSGDDTIEVLSWVEGEPFEWNDLHALEDVGRFLARFHATLSDDIPPGKEGFPREDHPDLMEDYVARIGPMCESETQARKVKMIGEQLDIVRRHLDGRLWPRLPMAVVHGDIHPGNVQFRNSKVAAVYDFDYLGVQARLLDIADAMMFFAARRGSTLDPDDIHSLTQPFELDLKRSTILLGAYQQTQSLTNAEWEALPLVIRSRWVQIRLRGSRKVPRQEKVPFVLDRFFELIEWLDRIAPSFLERLRDGLEGARRS